MYNKAHNLWRVEDPSSIPTSLVVDNGTHLIGRVGGIRFLSCALKILEWCHQRGKKGPWELVYRSNAWELFQRQMAVSLHCNPSIDEWHSVWCTRLLSGSSLYGVNFKGSFLLTAAFSIPNNSSTSILPMGMKKNWVKGPEDLCVIYHTKIV